jgi:hypothetical protein
MAPFLVHLVHAGNSPGQSKGSDQLDAEPTGAFGNEQDLSVR